MSEKNLVIIPSSVSPRMGVFTSLERKEQTLQTIASARQKIPNAFIVINDISLVPAPALKKELASLADIFIDSDLDPDAYSYSVNGQKSPGELILFSNALMHVRSKVNITEFNRIFKIGARCKVKDTFLFSDHATANESYVFKSLPSWLDSNTKLYITRLWSMCPTQIDAYIKTVPALMERFTQGYDTEHAHYMCFKNNTKEVTELHVECKIAPNGSLHED